MPTTKPNKLTWDQAILVEVMRWVWWIMSAWNTDRNRPYMLMFGVDPAEIESYLDRADMAAEDYHLILKRRCAHLTPTQQQITIDFLEEITAIRILKTEPQLYQPTAFQYGDIVMFHDLEAKIYSICTNRKGEIEYSLDTFPNKILGRGNLFFVTEDFLLANNTPKSTQKEN